MKNINEQNENLIQALRNRRGQSHLSIPRMAAEIGISKGSLEAYLYGYKFPRRDVLEKIVTDYAILPTKPNMEEVKRALTRLENHSIIQRIDGKFNKGSCKFAILPTVLSVVSAEKLNMIVSALRKEENDEEIDEDSAG